MDNKSTLQFDFKHKIDKLVNNEIPTTLKFRQDKHWSMLEELILFDWSNNDGFFTVTNISKRVGKTNNAVYSKRSLLLNPEKDFVRIINIDDKLAKVYVQKAKRFFENGGFTVTYDDTDFENCRKMVILSGKTKTIYITIKSV